VYDPRKFFKIVSLCRDLDIDIIHAHLFKPILGGLLSTYFHDTPVLVHEHEPISVEDPQYAFYRWMLRRLKDRAVRYLAVSGATANHLTELCGICLDDIEILHNSVDNEQFAPNPELRETLRAELGIEPNATVIGFVGRLTHQKGPDILLNAFKLVAKRRPDFQLIFMGAGDLEAQLRLSARRANLASRVRFLGFVDNIGQLLNTVDIGCLPSRNEPFGIAALEMMSAGIPLITSGNDGLAEFAVDGVTALIFNNCSETELASRIIELSNNPELQQDLRQNAMERARAFSTPAYCDTMERIYRELLNPKG